MLHSDSFSIVGQDIRRLDSSKAEKYEVRNLESEVQSLKHKVNSYESEAAGLRSDIQILQNQVNGLMERETNS
jgi:uncharacterized coiled-coil DUF342 family protein